MEKEDRANIRLKKQKNGSTNDNVLVQQLQHPFPWQHP